jgi:hypothetical protein
VEKVNLMGFIYPHGEGMVIIKGKFVEIEDSNPSSLVSRVEAKLKISLGHQWCEKRQADEDKT